MTNLLRFSCFAALIACTDKSLSVNNAIPEAWITSHDASSEFLEGDVILFFGSATDSNHQEQDLITHWYADNRELCMNVTPLIDGTTKCETSLQAGDEILRLQVIDPLGETAFNELQIVVYPFSDPELTYLSPLNEQVYYSDIPISFRAEVADAQDQPDELEVVWDSSQDGVLEIASPDAAGLIDDFAFLSAGNHIISLTVQNHGGKIAEYSETITVRPPNQPPTCNIMFPADGAAEAFGADIILQAQVADPDVDISYLQTSWHSDRDGFLGDGVFDNGLLILNTNTLTAAQHTLSLLVEDEQGLSCSDSIQVMIGRPPTVSVVFPSDGQVFNIGEDIPFEGLVSDQEDPLDQIGFAWRSDIDGVFAQGNPTSTGTVLSNFSSLSSGQHQIDFEATDPAGFTHSDAVQIRINTPPDAPEISLLPASPQSNEALEITVISSVDVDGDTLSFSYEWYQNGVLTSYQLPSLPASYTDVGDTWKVIVTADDGYIEGDSAEAQVVIQNSIPEITVPVISPNSAYNDDVLTCTASATDIDQLVSVSYSWEVNNQTVSGATLDLSSVVSMPTDTVTCTAQAIDDQQGTATSSSSITLQNRAPSLVSHVIQPNAAYVGAALSCDAEFADPDGESLSIIYEWTAPDGSVLGTDPIYVVQEGDAQPGEEFTCTASAEDGYGGSLSSAAMVMIFSAPVFDIAASISPSQAYTGTALSCTAAASDAEDGAVSVSYAWKVGATTLASGPSYTVNSNDIAVGETLECVASATDTDGNTAQSIAEIIIENTEPTIDSVVISPSPLYNDSLATCAATGTDPDESLSFSYSWSHNTQNLGTSDQLDLGNESISPEDTLICVASTIDSFGVQVQRTETIVITNRLPSAPELEITPSIPELGVDDLLCSIVVPSLDEDGDAVSYQYSWSLDGVINPSYTTDTIPAADLLEDQEWTCMVTPFDGRADGTVGEATLNTPKPCANTPCDLSVYFPDGTGIDFVEIPSGSFSMGSPSTELGRESLKESQHTVTLTRDFYMMTTEMNQAMFEVLMGYNPSFLNCGIDCAIEKISWHEAAYFSNLLTDYFNNYLSLQLDSCYSCTGAGTTAYCTENVSPIYDCSGFRLPTEAEWEYASRAGSAGAFHDGGNLQGNSWEYTSCTSSVILDNGTNVAELAWYCGNANSDGNGNELPSPIALTTPNAWGLYDMHGNVREWCHDAYAQNYGGTSGNIVDPIGSTSNSQRVIKGGSWDQNPKKLRSAYRYFSSPSDNLQSFGFRLVMTK